MCVCLNMCGASAQTQTTREVERLADELSEGHVAGGVVCCGVQLNVKGGHITCDNQMWVVRWWDKEKGQSTDSHQQRLEALEPLGLQLHASLRHPRARQPRASRRPWLCGGHVSSQIFHLKLESRPSLKKSSHDHVLIIGVSLAISGVRGGLL
jgi:hypothetical protein